MPGFDQSGPRGEGPMTGGARGRCVQPAVGYGQGSRFGMPGYGRGMAFRHGLRGNRGYGAGINRFASAPGITAGNPADELNALRNEANLLNESLKNINNRINEIEKLL